MNRPVKTLHPIPGEETDPAASLDEEQTVHSDNR